MQKVARCWNENLQPVVGSGQGSFIQTVFNWGHEIALGGDQTEILVDEICP